MARVIIEQITAEKFHLNDFFARFQSESLSASVEVPHSDSFVQGTGNEEGLVGVHQEFGDGSSVACS